MSAQFTLAASFTDRTQKVWDWFSGSPLHILVIVVVAVIVQRIGRRAITRAMNRLASVDLVHGPGHPIARQKERAKTTGTVLTSTFWIASAMRGRS